MNKVILMSIQPKWLVKILNGEKTLELRKSVPKDFKGWVYVYATKGKKNILYKYKDKYYTQHYLTFTDSVEVLNSKVAFRFWFDEYSEFKYNYDEDDYLERYDFGIFYDVFEPNNSRLCLTKEQFLNYGNGKDLYAWHIKKLEIFDEPKRLSEFYKKVEFLWADTGYCNKGGEPIEYHPIEKAPQSWQYAYVEEKFD